MTTLPVADIARTFQLSEDELYRQALASFLVEKKGLVLQHQREILARYGATSATDLEHRITQGIVQEHPAWEDLIVVENLAVRLDELHAFLNRLTAETLNQAKLCNDSARNCKNCANAKA